MKANFSVLWAIAALFLLEGCSDLIRAMREDDGQIAAEEDDRDPRAESERPARRRNVRGLSANNVSHYDPPASRAYGRRLASRLEEEAPSGGETPTYSPPLELHRATRQDFVDRAAAENSLWDSQGQGNYLFANNRRREMGDLVTADVEKELRREIQFQLWMTLPPEQRRMKKNGGDSVSNVASAQAKDPNSPEGQAANKAPEKSGDQKAKDAAEEAAKTNMAPPSKDDDIIKMEVVENLGNGLVRMVGQKRVIYRGVSRVVEVAAIVNNKDIDDSNHLKSSTFLDMKAQVIQ